MTDRTYSTTGTNNVTSDYEGYANPLPVYANNAVDKMTNENIYNKVYSQAEINASQPQNKMTLENIYKADEIGQQLKKAILQGVMDFGKQPATQTRSITTPKPAWKKSTIDYNYPEVHYPLDKGKRMTVKKLGAAPPLFEHIRRL
jgi:hypothetical protein